MEKKIKYPSTISKNKKEVSLAYFIHDLRGKYKKKKLSKRIIEKCESIPGWKWETIYEWVSKEKFIQWCKDNGIKSKTDFQNICKEGKRPYNIPSLPNVKYDNFSWHIISGFINHLTKEEFIQWCKDNEIKSQNEFRKAYMNLNKTKRRNIPSNPNNFFGNFSWTEISGYILSKDRNYASEEEFIQWCKDSEIKSQNDYINRKPNNFPYSPNLYYNFSWADFGIRCNSWLSKEEFIQWCKDNEIEDRKHYESTVKRKKRAKNSLPSSPHKVYENWSWSDISGYRKFLSKEEFIQWCKDNEIKNQNSFLRWTKNNKKLNYIPSVPYNTYENWSWSDVSGYGKFISREEFIQWCKDNGIKNRRSFYKIYSLKKLNYIPSVPYNTYENWSWYEIKKGGGKND